ncbi:MAG: hypothetical protein ACRCV9_00605 [Burkholderiaceae bacterium]
MSTLHGFARMFCFGMADDALIRLENFKALWPNDFSPAQVAADLWGTPAFWSDLYRGKKSFGEKLARRIEDKLGLVRLSLDDPAGAQRAPLTSDLAKHLQGLDSEAQWRAENVLRAHLGLAPIPRRPGTFGKQDAA